MNDGVSLKKKKGHKIAKVTATTAIATVSALVAEVGFTGTAHALTTAAVENYESAWWSHQNPTYHTWGDGCAEFATQVLIAGGERFSPASVTVNDAPTNQSYWWDYDLVTQYTHWPQRPASYTATLAYTLKQFLLDHSGWAVTEGSWGAGTRPGAGQPFSGNMKGDLFFYNWHYTTHPLTITHASIESWVGATNTRQQTGTLVDQHTPDQAYNIWTERTQLSNTNYAEERVYFVHITS